MVHTTTTCRVYLQYRYVFNLFNKLFYRNVTLNEMYMLVIEKIITVEEMESHPEDIKKKKKNHDKRTEPRHSIEKIPAP